MRLLASVGGAFRTVLRWADQLTIRAGSHERTVRNRSFPQEGGRDPLQHRAIHPPANRVALGRRDRLEH
ncbi:MAG TPA: hypothetical protein DCQ94_05180 [Nitrospira sp.]|nr:hypothetical protein [Nitrospira sp.]